MHPQTSSSWAERVCAARHCESSNFFSRPILSASWHWRVPRKFVPVARLPLGQIRQYTPSKAVGAGVATGAGTGAFVGSFGQPHRPFLARTCAVAHCSNVYPTVRPMSDATPHVNGIAPPMNVARTASRSVGVPPSVQMKHGNNNASSSPLPPPPCACAATKILLLPLLLLLSKVAVNVVVTMIKAVATKTTIDFIMLMLLLVVVAV